MMDLAAKHVAFVVAAYGISGIVLAALLVWVLARRKALHRHDPNDGSDLP
jgi:heme exporter protein CcmD